MVSHAAPGRTLGAAVTAYLDSIQVKGTKDAYRKALHPMRDHFGAGTPLADIDPADVADWLSQTWGSKAAATYNLRLRAVRSASAWWEERGWITGSLASKAKAAKNRPVLDADVLTPAEVEAILAQCSLRWPTGVRNKALFTLLYKSGLRLGEALAFRPGDIDHAEHSIRLRHTKAGQPQTRYYHASAEDALNAWLARRHDAGVNGRNPVFCTIHDGPRFTPGQPLAQNSVRLTLKRLAEKAGVEKRVHPHGLRDAFAVDLQRQGVAVSAISKLLGHASVASTDAYLGKLTNGEAGKILAAVEGREPTVAELAAELAEVRRQLAQMQEEKQEG
jgi:integrase/recombinase XerD